MGLDMYFKKHSYVKNWEHNGPEGQHKITVKKGGKTHPNIKPERISNIVEEVGYWRKFNALHNWFVENVQEGVDDCKDYYVSPEEIKELVAELKMVCEDKDKAKELLPTASGFFFGGTDYDEYYFSEVKRTIELFEELLKEEGGDFYYSASW